MNEKEKIIGLLDPRDYPTDQVPLVEEFNKKLLEMSEANAKLTMTISHAEQHRQSVIAGSLRFYNVNISRNLIEDEIYDYTEGRETPVFETYGLPNPCPLDCYVEKMIEVNVPYESRTTFREHFDYKKILRAYIEGERRRVAYFKITDVDGSLKTIKHSMMLVNSPDTGDIVAMCNAEDASNEEMVKRLETNQRNMMLLHESLGSGSWSMDFNEIGEMVSCNWSDTFRHMLGYRNEEDFPNVLDSWTNIIYPDDKKKVLAAYWNAVNDYSGRLHYDVEYRVYTRNNGLRWVHAAGRLSRREDGTPISFVGLFVDINDRKEHESQLKEQLSIVEALSRDYLNIYKINMERRTVVVMKQNGYSLRDFNRLGVEYDYEAFAEKYVNERVLEVDTEKMHECMKLSKVEENLFGNGEFISNFRIYENSEKHYLEFKFIRLADDPKFVILGFKNIDTIMSTTKERDNLRHLSETDIMTGLLNRGSGEKKASEEIKKGYRGMLILCDIDKFKSINDTFGHGVGDKVICSIADCLKRSFREDDIVFRLGGDEFSALALNVDSKVTATAIIERLFERIDAIDIPELGDRKVTISVGAAMMDGVFETSFQELYKKADTAVYESKKFNSNKVTFYSGF